MRLENRAIAPEMNTPEPVDWCSSEAPPPAYLRAPPSPRRPRVLVAAGLDSSSAVALLRADAMATALGAELHVLHVVPRSSWLDAIFPRRAANDAATAARSSPAAVMSHRWCETMLARGFPQNRILIRQGEVAPRILAVADELDAVLIVVGGSPSAGGGRIATRIVRQARRPVVVARPPTASSAIVAATDFSDDAFPALSRASDLGFQLHAPVTFVHNLDWTQPVVLPTGLGAPVLVRDDAVDTLLEHRHARLSHVAACLAGQIDTIIVSRENTVEAILDVARALDADLVVVGSHRRRGFARITSRGTAEAVATTARRCVLTVPLDVGGDRAA